MACEDGLLGQSITTSCTKDLPVYTMLYRGNLQEVKGAIVTMRSLLQVKVRIFLSFSLSVSLLYWLRLSTALNFHSCDYFGDYDV